MYDLTLSSKLKEENEAESNQQISKGAITCQYWLHGDVLLSNTTFLIFAFLVVWCSHSRPYKTFKLLSFYPRDAIYAGAGISYGPVSVCVCLSQVGVLSKLMNESGWFLAWQLTSTYPPLRCKEIRVSSTIRVPSGTLLQTLDLEILLRRIDCRNVLSRKVDDQSVINWVVVIPPNCDARPL